jgi:hypothetical protein
MDGVSENDGEVVTDTEKVPSDTDLDIVIEEVKVPLGVGDTLIDGVSDAEVEVVPDSDKVTDLDFDIVAAKVKVGLGSSDIVDVSATVVLWVSLEVADVVTVSDEVALGVFGILKVAVAVKVGSTESVFEMYRVWETRVGVAPVTMNVWRNML